MRYVTKHRVRRATFDALANADACDWYVQARQYTAELAKETGHDVDYTAAVLAIVSPRVSVSKSLGLARTYLTLGSTHGMLPNVESALLHYEMTREIRGPKTRAFYEALMGDDDAIVLDVWMARYFGITDRRIRNKQASAPARRLIKETAKQMGWSCVQVQSALWAASIRNAGRTPATFGG